MSKKQSLGCAAGLQLLCLQFRHKCQCSVASVFMQVTGMRGGLQLTLHIDAEIIISRHREYFCVIDSSVKLIHCEGGRTIYYAITRIKHTTHEQVYQFICTTAHLHSTAILVAPTTSNDFKFYQATPAKVHHVLYEYTKYHLKAD